FEAISDIGRRMTEVIALENFLPSAARLVRGAFGWSLACILTVDAASGELVVAGADAADPSHARRVLGHRQPIGAGLCGLALRDGRPVNVTDTSREPAFLAVDGLVTRSELVVPIRAEGRALGVVDIQSERAGAFDETDVAVLR